MCYAVLRSFVCCADGSHLCLACVCESVTARPGALCIVTVTPFMQKTPRLGPSGASRGRSGSDGNLASHHDSGDVRLASPRLGRAQHLHADCHARRPLHARTWAARTTPTIRLPITTATQLGATHHSSHSANPVSLDVTCRQQQWWRQLRRLRARLPGHLHSHLLPH